MRNRKNIGRVYNGVKTRDVTGDYILNKGVAILNLPSTSTGPGVESVQRKASGVWGVRRCMESPSIEVPPFTLLTPLTAKIGKRKQEPGNSKVVWYNQDDVSPKRQVGRQTKGPERNVLNHWAKVGAGLKATGHKSGLDDPKNSIKERKASFSYRAMSLHFAATNPLLPVPSLLVGISL